jgi:hypothetical protein
VRSGARLRSEDGSSELGRAQGDPNGRQRKPQLSSVFVVVGHTANANAFTAKGKEVRRQEVQQSDALPNKKKC